MKIGRNDPCLCGSGKKYKKCCGASEAGPRFIPHEGGELSFMEKRGTPNTATFELKKAEAALRDRAFDSVGDARIYLDEYYRQRNREVLSDFLGLTSEDMHLILRSPEKAVERLVEFEAGPEAGDAPKIPILRETLYLLEALKTAPLRLTAAGYLPPAFVGEWFDAAFMNEEKTKDKLRFRPKRENDGYDLPRVRAVCERRGLAETDRGRLRLTDKGERLLGDTDFRRIYRELFAGFVELYADDDHETNERVSWIAGHSLLFSLYALGKKAKKGIDRRELTKLFRTAFPADKGLKDELTASLHLLSSCLHPAMELGLLEEIPLLDLSLKGDDSVVLGPLCDRLLKWKK